MVVLEEWKSKIPFHILKHVEERGEVNLGRAAELADAYALLVESLGSRERATSRHVRSSSDDNLGGVSGRSKGPTPTPLMQPSFIVLTVKNQAIRSRLVNTQSVELLKVVSWIPNPNQ